MIECQYRMRQNEKEESAPMLKSFKPSETARAKSKATPSKTSSRTRERRLLPRPLPTPEVIEGNDESDWSLWEQSVSFQDSQMQPAWTKTKPMPMQGAAPGTESEAADPFASVRRNSG